MARPQRASERGELTRVSATSAGAEWALHVGWQGGLRQSLWLGGGPARRINGTRWMGDPAMMARVRWRSVGKGASGDASWEGAGGGGGARGGGGGGRRFSLSATCSGTPV
jgi:hypothetical protein